MARPKKENEEIKKDIIAHIKAGLTLEETAKLLHLNRDTIYDWKKKDKEFSDTLDAQKQSTIQSEVKKAITTKELVKILIKKAKGFKYTEITTIFDGNNTLQQTKKIEKYVAPDTDALEKLQEILENVSDEKDKQLTINFIRKGGN